MSEELSRATTIIQAIIKPIAKLCIRRAISIRDILELLKKEMISAAKEEWHSAGKKANVSKISIMTGIQRKDVMRLLAEKAETPIASATITSRVLAQWEQDSRFLDKAGNPKVLKHEGEDSEFKKLVAVVSKDLNPGTILSELERLNLVKRSGTLIELVKGAHSVDSDILAGYQLLAADINDLTTAVDDNLATKESIKHLHARTEFDNIYIVKNEEVKKWLLEKGTLFHKEVRTYLAKHDADFYPLEGEQSGLKVVFGTYSFTESKKENK